MFSVAACVAYTLAYYFDWSLFQFYVGDNSFHTGVQPVSAGAPILWYGWLATAVLVGAVVALLAPPRLVAPALPDLLWLIPAVAILAAFFYEKRWFM
jgi:hypothetical protein